MLSDFELRKAEEVWCDEIGAGDTVEIDCQCWEADLAPVFAQAREANALRARVADLEADLKRHCGCVWPASDPIEGRSKYDGPMLPERECGYHLGLEDEIWSLREKILSGPRRAFWCDCGATFRVSGENGYEAAFDAYNAHTKGCPKATTLCAGCGERVPGGNPTSAAFHAHVRTCEKHPFHEMAKHVAALEADNGALVARVGELQDELGLAHVQTAVLERIIRQVWDLRNQKGELWALLMNRPVASDEVKEILAHEAERGLLIKARALADAFYARRDAHNQPGGPTAEEGAKVSMAFRDADEAYRAALAAEAERKVADGR